MAEAKEHERNRKRRREGRYVRVARIAHAAGQDTLPCHSHPKSPPSAPCPDWPPACYPASTLTQATAIRRSGSWPPRGSLSLGGFPTAPPSIGPTAWGRMRRALLTKPGWRGKGRGSRPIPPGFASPRRAPRTHFKVPSSKQ